MNATLVLVEEQALVAENGRPWPHAQPVLHSLSWMQMSEKKVEAMDITRNDQFGLPILSLRGHLGNKSWPLLLAQIRELAELGVPRIALDLSRISRMGRGQALLLADAEQRLAGRGQTLSIVGLSPKAIEIMGQALFHRRRTRA